MIFKRLCLTLKQGENTPIKKIVFNRKRLNIAFILNLNLSLVTIMSNIHSSYSPHFKCSIATYG